MSNNQTWKTVDHSNVKSDYINSLVEEAHVKGLGFQNISNQIFVP